MTRAPPLPILPPLGFRGLSFQVGAQRDVNFRLSIGSAQQTIEVTAEAPIVESTETEISTMVSDQDGGKSIPTG